MYSREFVSKELTEAQFDEAAGEKDACYRKVKSRYKVWPSAYASGALQNAAKLVRLTGERARRSNMLIQEILSEEWSQKYKKSINCSNPKGFSQKAHCAGKKKNEDLEENLRDWFGKGKKGGAGGGGWDRYNTKGERIGKCGDAKKSEGKPKCLSKSRAASLRAKGGKKAIAAAVNKKRRDDPNKNRTGKAKNVSNTVKTRKKK